MYHYGPPSPLDALRPPLQPHGASYGVGPGPLSPVWPRPVPPKPPANEWAAIADALIAIRRDIAETLRPENVTPFFFLGIDERRVIETSIAALRRANVELLDHKQRSAELAAWPTPVLPTNALFGARDVLPILSIAIRVATFASERAIWLKDNPWYAASR